MAQVLLVDDDPLIGKTLVDLLSLHGYAATRAESAERGLDDAGRRAASTSCCSTCGCPG